MPKMPARPESANAEGSGTADTAVTMKLSTRSVPPVPTVPPLAEVVLVSTRRIKIVESLFRAVTELKSTVDVKRLEVVFVFHSGFGEAFARTL